MSQAKTIRRLLSTSIFDLSEIRSKTEAYLDAQYELADKQRKNMSTTGLLHTKDIDPGGTFGAPVRAMRWGVPEWVERITGAKCAKSGAYMQNLDFTLQNARLCANPWELDLITNSKALKFEFDNFLKGTAFELGNKKKEILRDEVGKYQIQSDLMSEASSAKQDLTYEPMKVPNDSVVRSAQEALEEEQKKSESSPAILVELRDKYQKLAGAFFAGLPKFATGGLVDNILARLSPGEFVLRADAVKQVGVPFLNALNNFKYPVPAFAGGGIVESASSMSAATGQPAQARDIHLNVNITGAGEITEKQVRKWVLPAVNKIRRLES
jgi:hypothetical protein